MSWKLRVTWYLKAILTHVSFYGWDPNMVEVQVQRHTASYSFDKSFIHLQIFTKNLLCVRHQARWGSRDKTVHYWFQRSSRSHVHHARHRAWTQISSSFPFTSGLFSDKSTELIFYRNQISWVTFPTSSVSWLSCPREVGTSDTCYFWLCSKSGFFFIFALAHWLGPLHWTTPGGTPEL